MCRYESGFFYRHELLRPYKYYWRLECAASLTAFLTEYRADPPFLLSPLLARVAHSPNVQYCASLRL